MKYDNGQEQVLNKNRVDEGKICKELDLLRGLQWPL